MISVMTHGRELDSTVYVNPVTLPIPGLYRLHLSGGGGGGGGRSTAFFSGDGERGGRGGYSSSGIYAKGRGDISAQVSTTGNWATGGVAGANGSGGSDGTGGGSVTFRQLFPFPQGSTANPDPSGVVASAASGAGGRGGTGATSYNPTPAAAIFPYDTSEEYGKGGKGGENADTSDAENGNRGAIAFQLIG